MSSVICSDVRLVLSVVLFNAVCSAVCSAAFSVITLCDPVSSVVCLIMYVQLRELLYALMHPIMLSRSESPAAFSPMCISSFGPGISTVRKGNISVFGKYFIKFLFSPCIMQC